jgi:hypothetical protein
MAAKSSANENKVFTMTLKKPRPKTRGNGRGAGKAWKSGRGEVFFAIWSSHPQPSFSFFVCSCKGIRMYAEERFCHKILKMRILQRTMLIQ